jgi:hypothetical protein
MTFLAQDKGARTLGSCLVGLPSDLASPRSARIGLPTSESWLVHVGLDRAENESCSLANQTRADLLD